MGVLSPHRPVYVRSRYYHNVGGWSWWYTLVTILCVVAFAPALILLGIWIAAVFSLFWTH